MRLAVGFELWLVLAVISGKRATSPAVSSAGAVLAPLLLICCTDVAPQDLEPRAYSPNPVGVSFLILGFAHSSGDVLTDTSLPLSDVEVKMNAGVLGYGHTFDLFGRSASLALAIPHVSADASGDVGEARREVERVGFGDPRLRFAINLLGVEALTREQFAARRPQTALGASIVIVPPLGEYNSDHLINLGAHRWAFKPELGLSQPLGRWYFEAYAGVWLFTDNDDFFGGHHREQEPISALQTHVSYTFRPQLWLAANATYYRGGKTTLDDRANADLQSNSRVGVTLSLPLGRQQSLKLSWSDGMHTRSSGDFTSFGLAWQLTWFD